MNQSLSNVPIQLPSTSQSAASFINISQSGPLLLNEQKYERIAAACFSDGRKEVNMSNSFKKAHPQHFPTGTTEVLTFYPTLNEFKDFNGYIQKIEAAGAHLKCGIAKIVPPEGWHPRPKRRNNYSDMDDFEMNNPVKETIEGKSGIFYKTNKVFRKKMSVKEFRKLANSQAYRNPKPELEGVELESEYFKNILNREPIYGADTEGTAYDPEVNEFNMSRLNTILDETKSDSVISGVNTVYLYFGMYKTTFPWHAEDMDLYSINYLHFGAPKYWFAISSESAERFERMMLQQFAGSDIHCKAFLRHKSYIVTPSILKAYNIPYGTMIQRPNEFIITFPKGYHMGFNTGYNLAESTNFAADRWIDYGKNAILCKCVKDTVEIDMRPYMKKYRADEYERWFAYWYGDRITKMEEKAKKMKKASGLKKRSEATNRNEGIVAKRARLGADGSLSGGSISGEKWKNQRDAVGVSDRVLYESHSDSQWSPSPSPANDSSTGSIFATTMSSKNYDMSGALNIRTDCEELRKRFKRNTKDLVSCAVNLFAEREFNKITAKYWPHCDVCSYFQPKHIKPRCSIIPEKSRRLLTSWNFAKHQQKSESESEIDETFDDLLITCRNCQVTVHSGCCSGESTSNWICLRCRHRSDIEIRSLSCSLCELRGGALIPCRLGTDMAFAHIVCALFNRRTIFDRAYGPTMCFTIAPPKQNSPEFPSHLKLPIGYLTEFGDVYERSRWECQICRKSKEGLIPCNLCFEEASNAILPTTTHVTCARQVGYLMEVRHFPKNTIMICDRHQSDYLIEKMSYVNIKIGDEVFASPNGEMLQKGCVELIENKMTLVVDFLDGSVSRDLIPSDIISCECAACDGIEHQDGSRVKVKWDDGLIYDGYFRGIGKLSEYRIRFQNGSFCVLPRAKILSKREMSTSKKI